MNASLLQRQVTQFDTTRTQASIATPTCSSCCCCCCCLGSSIAASVSLPIDIDQRTPKKTSKLAKTQAKTYAALAVPATVVFWIFANAIIPGLANNLMSLSFAAIPIVLLPLFGMILMAYHTASFPKATARALSATAIIAGALIVEAVAGMMILLAGGGAGMILYLAGATVLVVTIPMAIQTKKKKKPRKDTSNYDTW